MTALEHYFENLLHDGKDVEGGINKNLLSEDQIDAVEQCYQYVAYTMFNNESELRNFLNKDNAD